MAPALVDLELATFNLRLTASLPEPTGMMTTSSFWGNRRFFQNPKGPTPYLGFKIFDFKNLPFLLRGSELPSFIPPMFSEYFFSECFSCDLQGGHIITKWAITKWKKKIFTPVGLKF